MRVVRTTFNPTDKEKKIIGTGILLRLEIKPALCPVCTSKISENALARSLSMVHNINRQAQLTYRGQKNHEWKYK
jgi:hypothetical protein